MSTNRLIVPTLQHLRDTAEAQISRATPRGTSSHSRKEILHELEVYKIELEMQNAALRESQAALRAARARCAYAIFEPSVFGK